MAEIKRPVFFSGENPGMTLYIPGTEQVLAVASYWHCTDSPWGVGHALVLWLAAGALPTTPIGPGGVFTDNIDLAHILVNRLTRHFPEFQHVPVATLPFSGAGCEHSYDGSRYQVKCQTQNAQVEVDWSEPLDRKQVNWPQFPAGDNFYDLTTVICPCRAGHIKVNGQLIGGEAQIVPTPEGFFLSSAFLAFAETWIGPLVEHP